VRTLKKHQPQVIALSSYVDISSSFGSSLGSSAVVTGHLGLVRGAAWEDAGVGGVLALL